MGPVVVAIDNSASVDEDVVNYNCSNMFAIARDVKPERIHVILCDTPPRSEAHGLRPAGTRPTASRRQAGAGPASSPVFDFIATTSTRSSPTC